MNQYRIRWWIIWLSFLAAIILEETPWPKQFIYYRPTWLILILIFWVANSPCLINIGTGFFLGMLMDLIQGLTLGEHALAYSIICYLVSYKYQLFRNMALWHQSFIIAGLSIIMNFILFLTEFFSHFILFHTNMFWNCLVNAILWPWIFSLLRKIRREFLIY